MLKDMSLEDLEKLWIELWLETFDVEVEPEETKETATVLQELIRRVTDD